MRAAVLVRNGINPESDRVNPISGGANMNDESSEDTIGETWGYFYDRLCDFMLRFGTENADQKADCWVDDEHFGRRQQKIYVRNLALLRPEVVTALQGLLNEFPGWEIMVAVSVPGPGELWPDMGMTIREHEIIDGLQREYFPEEFRGFAYTGSRPGTDED